MIKASVHDKAMVVKLLALSFEKNQSVNYIIRQDEKRKERIRALMDYSFEICCCFGEVYLSDDRKACALVLYPDQKKTTLKTILLDVKLVVNAIGISGIIKALKREALIKKKQPDLTMYYLWFIGVAPVSQHKGIGSKLLQELVANAKSQNRTVFLETSTTKNLPWYERFGFRVYDTLELGYHLYFLNNLPV